MADADTAEFLKRGGTEALAEHALAAVRRALEGGSEPLGPWPSAPNLSLEEHVSGLASALARYATHRRAGSDKEGRAALSLAAQHFHRLHWPHPAWRGTNLGGLLLLEPGPAHPFFEDTARALFPGGNGSVGGCEWALCEAIDQERATTVHFDDVEDKAGLFARHRREHFGPETMRDIKAAGLNAVRVPFGYWVVSGPTGGDVYAGPDLGALDRVVELAGAAGLQVLLDLHGAPGGENALRPCGREHPRWAYQDWRLGESLAVLATIAARYAGAPHVTGVQVCNEPSPCIPAARLVDFYEDAVRAIRSAGMGPAQVAVVLPVHTPWRAREILSCWGARGNLLQAAADNVVWDLHLYHDFSDAWALLSHARHAAVVEENARVLASLPGAVVGEWSLARPSGSAGSGYSEEEVADFATRQVRAYNHASHGWFFWNWRDHPSLDKWDLQRGVLARGRLPLPLPPALLSELARPEWYCVEDPGREEPAGTGAAVNWLGRTVIDPIVGLIDGGPRSAVRRLLLGES